MERSCKDGPSRSRSRNPQRLGSRRLHPYKRALGFGGKEGIGHLERVGYETQMKGGGHTREEEVVDLVVFCREGESVNPSQRRARYRCHRRGRRGLGRLEVGVGSEDQGIGAAEGIRGRKEALDLGILD